MFSCSEEKIGKKFYEIGEEAIHCTDSRKKNENEGVKKENEKSEKKVGTVESNVISSPYEGWQAEIVYSFSLS